MSHASPTSGQLSVLVVTPKADLGGAERWLLAVGDHAQRLRLSVLVLDEGPLLQELDRRGWPTWQRSTGRDVRGLGAGAAWFVRLVRAVRPDVILLNGVKPGLVALPGALLSRVPVVLVKHGSAFDRTLTPVVGRLCAACIVVSPDQAARLPARRTRVIPPARPAEVGTRRRVRVDPPWRLLMANRLVPNKGVDTAIRAVGQADNWLLVVAGGDDATAPGERARLVELAAGSGVASRVSLLGEVPSIDDLLSTADAVAVLSRPDQHHPTPAEGFGMVVLEAASAGVPVLADPQQVPSVAALSGEGVVPVLCTDVDAITRALRGLSDPVERQRVGEQGVRAARRHPGPAEVAELVTEVLLAASSR
jgi:glycosyltransferase involved in cell wall biosynthesis